MTTGTVTVSKREYDFLKKKVEISDDLLTSLVKGLEDIRTGRIRPWKKSTN